MPTVKLHYAGWLTLPADVQEYLDVSAGDRLEVEMMEGALVLRPVRETDEAAVLEPGVAVAQPAAAPAKIDIVPSKRGPGRPRKLVA